MVDGIRSKNFASATSQSSNHLIATTLILNFFSYLKIYGQTMTSFGAREN